MDIGTTLKRLRAQRTLTQQQLAAAAGVSQASLHYIEAGVNSPSLRTLGKIAGALGMSVTDLIDNGGDELDDTDTPDERGRAAARA